MEVVCLNFGAKTWPALSKTGPGWGIEPGWLGSENRRVTSTPWNYFFYLQKKNTKTFFFILKTEKEIREIGKGRWIKTHTLKFIRLLKS